MEKKKKIAKYSFETVQSIFNINNCTLITTVYNKKKNEIFNFVYN